MTKSSETIEIPISKLKTILLIVGCLVFVCLSVSLWTNADVQTQRSPIIDKAISIFVFVFFGAGLIMGPKKLFDNRPGLVISNEGILNNLGSSKGFFLPWSNITGFRTMQIRSTKLLLIDVNNADELINQQGKFNQRLMQYSINMSGTPIAIGSGTLKITFSELEKLLLDKHKAMKIGL